MNKAERTKQFIIEKAAPIINRKGMAGTSLTDIMEVTKLAKGGIYGNFASKDEIYISSFAYLTQTLSNQMDFAVSNGKTAKEQFFNLMRIYKGKQSTDGGCPILNFGVEADDTHPLMKEKVKKVILLSQKRIFDIISNGIANNEISPILDPKIFSIKAFAMIEGAILCRRLLDSDEQMSIVIDAIQKEFESYLI